MAKKDRLDEVLEVVLYLKENMATKHELTEVKVDLVNLDKKVDLHHAEVIGKLDGVNRRIDNEVDKRKVLDVRAHKLETKVFGK